jgi:hypothetical protein
MVPLEIKFILAPIIGNFVSSTPFETDKNGKSERKKRKMSLPKEE